jgi:hypothetical protein
MEDTLLILLGFAIMGMTFIFPIWIMMKHWEKYTKLERSLFIVHYIFTTLTLIGSTQM